MINTKHELTGEAELPYPPSRGWDCACGQRLGERTPMGLRLVAAHPSVQQESVTVRCPKCGQGQVYRFSGTKAVRADAPLP